MALKDFFDEENGLFVYICYKNEERQGEDKATRNQEINFLTPISEVSTWQSKQVKSEVNK